MDATEVQCPLFPFGTTCCVFVSFEKECTGADMPLYSLRCCRDTRRISVDAVAPAACNNVGSIFSVKRSRHRHLNFFFIFTDNHVVTEVHKPSSRRICSTCMI